MLSITPPTLEFIAVLVNSELCDYILVALPHKRSYLHCGHSQDFPILKKNSSDFASFKTKMGFKPFWATLILGPPPPLWKWGDAIFSLIQNQTPFISSSHFSSFSSIYLPKPQHSAGKHSCCCRQFATLEFWKVYEKWNGYATILLWKFQFLCSHFLFQTFYYIWILKILWKVEWQCNYLLWKSQFLCSHFLHSCCTYHYRKEIKK